MKAIVYFGMAHVCWWIIEDTVESGDRYDTSNKPAIDVYTVAVFSVNMARCDAEYLMGTIWGSTI